MGQGQGFVSGANADTLEPFTSGPWTGTKTWETAYGKYTDAQDALMCLCRWRQVKDEGYKKLLTAVADRYEAITRGDTLVMALLNLWAAKTKPDLDLGLRWSER